MIRTLIVDDEEPARRQLHRLLESDPDIEIVGEAAGGLEAVNEIERLRPDLVMLGVRMPGLDGFGVIEALQIEPAPEILFVTAYDEHALRAFEVNAIGYLLKPFDEPRLRTVFSRAKERILGRVPAAPFDGMLEQLRRLKPFPEHLLVRGDGKAALVPVHRIDLIEGARNYVVISEGSRTHIARTTLESIFSKLDPRKFSRISRSHVVRLEAIVELQPWTHGEYKVVLRDGRELMWTRRFLENLPEGP